MVNPPLIAIMLLLIPRVLPAGSVGGGGRIDARGAVLGTGALAALIFGISNGHSHGFATGVATGLALVPSTLTVVIISTFVSRRLLARIGVKLMLLAGLASMAAGQLWLAQISPGAPYVSAVLPGLLLTATGLGLGFPTASVAITSGVEPADQGLAGGLFVTGQQAGSAIGLAALAAIAASRTAAEHGSLASGYRLAFMIATGLALLACGVVATQISGQDCRQEVARQQERSPGWKLLAEAEAPLRKV